MPIRVQDELPAVNFLRNENVFVMTTTRDDSGNPPAEGAHP
jgi:homoserine O-succinyltransferase